MMRAVNVAVWILVSTGLLLAAPGVVVAVIDAGLDTGHPAFTGRLWTNPGEILQSAYDLRIPVSERSWYS